MLFVPRFLRCQKRSDPAQRKLTDGKRIDACVCSAALPTTKLFPGDHTGRVTPVPIPNTAVKPARADDSLTAKVGRCLDFLTTARVKNAGGNFENAGARKDDQRQ